jgi:hypothetical protein
MGIMKKLENPGTGVITAILTVFALAAAFAGFGIVWGSLRLVNLAVS